MCKIRMKAPRTSCAVAFAFLSALVVFTQQARAEGWGSVTGRFELEGAPPELPLEVVKGDANVKDAPCCAAQDVPNESLVVDAKTKGIQNIFVYLQKAPAEIHPSLKSSEKKELVLDQKGCRFIPHALVVRTDQQVVVKSDDNVAHNTHTYPIRGQSVNFILKPNDREGIKVPISATERLPVQVKCDIHPWMLAYWLVLDHPYAAVTDADGNFKIENLPAGEHEFIVWQERKGYLYRPGTDRFPTLKVKIEDGKTTELGTIKIPASKFTE